MSSSAPSAFNAGDANRLRVGVIHMIAQSLAAENNDEAMLLDRFDKHLHAGNLDLPNLLDHCLAALGCRPARPGDP